MIFGAQVVLAIVAAFRGWGFLPIGLLFGLFLFGYMLGAMFGMSALLLTFALDLGFLGWLVYAAIKGKDESFARSYSQ